MTSHGYLITKMVAIVVRLCTESDWRDQRNADNKLHDTCVNYVCCYGRVINDDHSIALISPITLCAKSHSYRCHFCFVTSLQIRSIPVSSPGQASLGMWAENPTILLSQLFSYKVTFTTSAVLVDHHSTSLHAWQSIAA